MVYPFQSAGRTDVPRAGLPLFRGRFAIVPGLRWTPIVISLGSLYNDQQVIAKELIS
jgi:hypothetical protein